MRCRRREPAWCQQYCSWKAAGAAGTQPPLVPGPSTRHRSCCGCTCGQHERARPVAPGGAGAWGALSSWKFLLASPERPLFGAQAPRSQHPVCTWGRDAEGLGPCEHAAGARQPQARCGGSRLPPAPLALAHGSPTAPATTRSLLSAQPGRALWWGQVLLQDCQEPPRCCWPRRCRTSGPSPAAWGPGQELSPRAQPGRIPPLPHIPLPSPQQEPSTVPLGSC